MNNHSAREDLKFKERSLLDLARFISTRAENTPNYTLLLGAGCSITSGIRSAGTLIQEWRREVIAPLMETENPTDEQIKDYLAKTHLPWYDKTKEYSCLFERRFDLQPQRRMFVENEVSNKKPSIGYAYLTALVNQSYFNTVFTTNFDDLLNEAFFQFSDLRPVICAHDSSINGITVTSKRPKIVKLHGDYLFDDIKATARETESLEQNMRLKFTEFAKDSGLVVVGYAGNDRSVMDVLSSLLRNEEYFKKGIYWCMREDSDVSEDLRKLLWKDRVYFVNIGGFDELFGELYAKFNKGDVVPISTRRVSNRTQEVIRTLIDGKNLQNSSSAVLREAHSTLSKELTTNELYNLLKKSKDDDRQMDNDALKDDELVSAIEASNLIDDGKYSAAIDLCREKIFSFSRKAAKKTLLKIAARAHKYLGENSSSLAILDELITIEPFVASHHLAKIPLIQEYADKLKIIEKAREANPHHYASYLEKSRLLKECSRGKFGAESIKIISASIDELDTGIKCDPSIGNPCWTAKFDTLSEVKDEKFVEREKLAILNRLVEQNPHSYSVLRMKCELVKKDSAAEQDNFLAVLAEATRRAGDEFDPDYEIIKFRALGKFERWPQLRAALDTKRDLLSTNSNFAIYFASVERRKFGNDDEAIKILQEALNRDSEQNAVMPLFSALIETNRVAEADRLLSTWANKLDPADKIALRIALLDKKNEFDMVLKESAQLAAMTNSQPVSDAYYLLKKGAYELAEAHLRKSLESHNFSLDADVDLINYELSKKEQKKKINERRILDLIDFSSSDLVKVAAYALLGNTAKLVEHLKAALSKDQSDRFQIRDWPAMRDYLTNPAISKLLDEGIRRGTPAQDEFINSGNVVAKQAA